MEIRLISAADYEILCNYSIENAEHFKMWEPERSRDYYALGSWRHRLVAWELAQTNHEAAYFIAVLNGKVIGHCNLTGVVRGVFCACYMGYAVAHNHEGRGIAFSLCKCAINYGFGELKLHRIMANYMPHNNRSSKLLKRLGFVREGLAKDYLQIAGKWENHVLTSLTNRSKV